MLWPNRMIAPRFSDYPERACARQTEMDGRFDRRENRRARAIPLRAESSGLEEQGGPYPSPRDDRLAFSVILTSRGFMWRQE